MPRPFWRATAEAVVAAVDAIYVATSPEKADYVAEFAQLTLTNADAALALAADLGFLSSLGSGLYQSLSPLCRSFATASQQRKATALRVALEVYEPFTQFKERLVATGDASTAARQVKRLLDLDAHHDDIKETLLSLGQYGQALIAKGGGEYALREEPEHNDLAALAQGCENDAAAEDLVRTLLGQRAVDLVSRDDVIVPLANALQRARATDGRGAVVSAGNAVESFLSGVGSRVAVNLTKKHGINAKADELHQRGNVMPKKLLNVSKYLGHIRNAADHGVDAEVGGAWDIRASTGIEYVYVACSFIAAVIEREVGGAVVL